MQSFKWYSREKQQVLNAWKSNPNPMLFTPLCINEAGFYILNLIKSETMNWFVVNSRKSVDSDI